MALTTETPYGQTSDPLQGYDAYADWLESRGKYLWEQVGGIGQTEDPTMADILSWTSTDPTSSWADPYSAYSDPSQFAQGWGSDPNAMVGRAGTGGYLSNLLEEAGMFEDWGIEGGPEWEANRASGKTISGFTEGIDPLQSILGQSDFANMSEEDLQAAIISAYDPMMQEIREQGTWQEGEKWHTEEWEGGTLDTMGTIEEAYEQYKADLSAENVTAPSFEEFEGMVTEGTAGYTTPTYSNLRFGEGDIEGMTNYLMAMQEGFKALPTQEDWGLGKKTADVYEKETQDIASAYEGYVPGEIVSRYSSLQGKGGEAAGEMGESQYLADIYGLGRQTGRDVRDLQGDFERDWRSSSRSWLESLT